MPLLHRKAAEPTWEVVDTKEVAPVPAYFSGTGVEIISVSPHDISQTYTFDAPTSFSPSPSINNMKVRRKLSIGNRRLSLIGSTFGLGGGPGTLSRTSSTTSSDSNDSIGSAVTFASSSDSSNGYRTLESHICMRDALVYAREQLIRGTEMKRAGGNVLFFEGWQVTRLRKNNQYRLQVRYFGRPAKAMFKTPNASVECPIGSPSSSPPFMDMLEDPWY